jgi:hypothetical protein
MAIMLEQDAERRKHRKDPQSEWRLKYSATLQRMRPNYSEDHHALATGQQSVDSFQPHTHGFPSDFFRETTNCF